jgi:hypothetical protein
MSLFARLEAHPFNAMHHDNQNDLAALTEQRGERRSRSAQIAVHKLAPSALLRLRRSAPTNECGVRQRYKSKTACEWRVADFFDVSARARRQRQRVPIANDCCH